MCNEIERKGNMTAGIGAIVNSALKTLVAGGNLGKVSNFADEVGITPDILTKKLHGMTPINIEEFWQWARRIRELDINRVAYPFLVRQVLQDFNISIDWNNQD